jgi:phosphate transport system protein
MLNPNNPRAQFEKSLEDLQQDVLRMAAVAEQMLHGAVHAYLTHDLAEVEEVIRTDDVVDRYNREIEARCLELLALQNPMARDLRVIAGTMKIITDVERIGDYSIDIAKMGQRMADKAPLPPQPRIEAMAAHTEGMLRDTIQAFVTRELRLVHAMIAQDDEVDRLNKEVIHTMIERIRENPDIAEQAIGAVMVARYIERIADHVTNVGEHVLYVETGVFTELHQ